MGEISDRIEALVATRHGRLAEVDTEIGAWSEAEAGLARIAKSLEAPTGRAEGAAAEEAAVLAGLRSEVAAMLEDLRAARCRFARPTINIGVSGKARVGKSTLLQSVSGRSDDQIPTGPHVPVTAVRSRILQSDRPRVLLRMHSPESFLTDVVAPYHRDLGLADRAGVARPRVSSAAGPG
ncbi:hypothetical protein [Streptomyces sp. NPDC051636]|uniref:hypothetical protein n=1 Tax=Streptomyces sp. NPDC051636 TaxID=3365663 RepID=UPI003793FAF4